MPVADCHSPTENAIASTTALRRWLALSVAICLAAGGAAILRRFDPSTPGYYPACPVHYWTGLHCPGCGTLRAIHHLLNGHLLAALAMNPLAVCSIPVFCWVGWRKFWRGESAATGDAPAAKIRWGWILFALILAYTVARNIPVWPLELLAPHSLD